MSKRKKAPPKRADDEKRKCLTWNMGDLNHDLRIIDDDDPALISERKEATSSSASRSNLPIAPDSWAMPNAKSHDEVVPSTSKGACRKRGSKKSPLEVTEPKASKSCGATSRRKVEIYEQYFVPHNDEHMKHLLCDCEAQCRVFTSKTLQDQEGEWNCEIGSFKVSLYQPDANNRTGMPISLPDVEQFWLYSSQIPGCNLIYFEPHTSNQENSYITLKKKIPTMRSVLYYRAHVDLPFYIIENFSIQKYFRLVCKSYAQDTEELEVTIILLETGLVQQQFPSEAPWKGKMLKKNLHTVQSVMSYFYGLEPPATTYPGKRRTRKHDINEFFTTIKEIHEKQPLPLRVDVQHPTLKPVLRPYQKQGVLWMLEKERYQVEKDEEAANDGRLHSLYEEVVMADGQKLFYNRRCGILVKDRPKHVENSPGGILADEMGLGKTVEVLACMLFNQRTDLQRPKSPPEVRMWVKDPEIPKPTSPAPNPLADAQDTTPSAEPDDTGPTSQFVQPIEENKIKVEETASSNVSGIPQESDSDAKPAGFEKISDNSVGEGEGAGSSIVCDGSQNYKPDGEMCSETFMKLESERSSSVEITNSSDAKTCLRNGGVNSSSGLVQMEIDTATCAVESTGHIVSESDNQPCEIEDVTIGVQSCSTCVNSNGKVNCRSPTTDRYTNICERMQLNDVQNGSEVIADKHPDSCMDGLVKSDVNSRQDQLGDLNCGSEYPTKDIPHCVLTNSDASGQTQSGELCIGSDLDLKDNSNISAITESDISEKGGKEVKKVGPTSTPSNVSSIETYPGLGSPKKGSIVIRPSVEVGKPVCEKSGAVAPSTMEEYDVTIMGDNVSESSRWEFWMKRKQKISPKKVQECSPIGSIEVTAPGSCTADVDSKNRVKQSAEVSKSPSQSLSKGESQNETMSDSLPVVVSEGSTARQTGSLMGTQGKEVNDSYGATVEIEMKHERKKKKKRKSKSKSSNAVTDKEGDLTAGTAEVKDSVTDSKLKCEQGTVSSSAEVSEVSSADGKVSFADGMASSDGRLSSAEGTLLSTDGNLAVDQVVAPKLKQKRVSKVKSSKYEVVVEADKVPPPKKGFSMKKTEQKEYFECVCGEKTFHYDSKLRVQCEKCGLWQHAKCVGYDVDDPDRGVYRCPHCHVSSPPVPSGATLIISPNSICHQWVEEIHKHIKKEKLKVFVYGGVGKHRFIQPHTLASHDIVITTYETLRKEVNYVDLPHSNSEKGRRLRHPKRFMAIPSPIIAVEWWRICLDEAQMVECTTTKTAEMALRLSAVNRWCITGTPIQHDLADLYGLLLFLGVDPYWVQHWWEVLLYEPYCYGVKEPMHQAISKVLWRTSKADVLDQLGLPTQSEKIHWLRFSPVEEHFYRQQYSFCYREATRILSRWDDNNKQLNSLDRYTLHWLLRPLLNLRQACCHPQAVRGAFVNVHKETMTMEEILAQLTKKSKTECEEGHRQMVAAMNGMAAIHIIREQYVEAVSIYRDVLRSVAEHEDRLRTDNIQQLHTLHNLDEVLTLGVHGIDKTLRDDLLKQQCREIREKYMAKAAANVASAQEALVPVQEGLKELSAELVDGENWWADVIQYAIEAGLDDVLVDRVRTDLQDSTNVDRTSLSYKFRNAHGMEYILNVNLEQLETAHETLIDALTVLDEEPSPNAVEASVFCCLRPAGEIRKTCAYCVADDLFSKYEAKLFSFNEQGISSLNEDGQYTVTTKRQGTWADSELEKTLKILASFTRHIAADECKELTEYGNVHIKIFEALKKEFKCLRNKWLYLRERVSAIDELNMATTRYRLRLEGEEPTDPPQPNILERHELELTKQKLQGDKMVAEGELRKKLGQLMYLNNLEKGQDQLAGGSNPEPCPICRKELGEEWSVMRCGHFFCLECIQIMLNDYSFGPRRRSLNCAICRQVSLHGEISYVSLKTSTITDEGDEVFKIKGDHSTKVTAVVRCLKQIQLNDPGAKALVFSTWQEVLNVIALALKQNNIGFKSLHAQNKFQSNLSSFRSDDGISVLLLPVHSGANGLNLIEATHILLVEPILNQAQELQAIGRIHRIGQTKPTFIHRFIVKATIEEKMHTLLKSVQSPINSHNSEDSNLTIGDLWSLFRREGADNEEGRNNQQMPSGSGPMIQENERSNLLEFQELMAETSVGNGPLTQENGPRSLPSSSIEFPEVRAETSVGNGPVIQENRFRNLPSSSTELPEVRAETSIGNGPVVQENGPRTLPSLSLESAEVRAETCVVGSLPVPGLSVEETVDSNWSRSPKMTSKTATVISENGLRDSSQTSLGCPEVVVEAAEVVISLPEVLAEENVESGKLSDRNSEIKDSWESEMSNQSDRSDVFSDQDSEFADSWGSEMSYHSDIPSEPPSSLSSPISDYISQAEARFDRFNDQLAILDDTSISLMMGVPNSAETCVEIVEGIEQTIALDQVEECLEMVIESSQVVESAVILSPSLEYK